MLVVSAEKEGQLICGNLPPVPKVIENYAWIKIGCDCAFQTKGAWIPYSLRACDWWAGEYQVSFPRNELLEARLNIPTWRENMTGLLPREVTIMIAADPIPKDIQWAAQGFAPRVLLTDLMHKIEPNKEEKRQTIKKINWEYREDSSFKFEWGNFNGGFGIFSTFLIILGLEIIGFVAWKCWRRRGRAIAGNPALADLAAMLPKGLANPLDAIKGRRKETIVCESSSATPTSTAILAVPLAVLVILVCVVVWRKRRRLLKKTVDGLYIKFSMPHHLEMVFLGELTIPYDHTFTEGNVLLTDVVLNQFCLRYTLTITWGLQLKGAATRPGQHPANIPLPETIAVSKKLALLMLGNAKYMAMTRLLKYSCNLATPIPMGVPRLVDAGWSDLGGENFPVQRRMDELPTAPRHTVRRDNQMDIADQDSRAGTGAVYEPLN